MRFDFKRGLIWVTLELTYEGARAAIGNCILDTGSATTAVEIDLIDFNFRKPSEITRLYGIGGGIQEVIAQKTGSMIIDKHELKNVEIEFGNINADMGINGFLGNDILKLFNININYSKQEIKFELQSDCTGIE